jgi:hypothetical protein
MDKMRREADCSFTEAWPRLVRWGVVLALGVGILWRVGRYLAQFPVWGDEAFILLNLLDLDYLGLAEGLNYAQVAPLLFLWTHEAALNLLGPSELAIRLAPLLAGIGGLLLYWRLCRHSLAPLQALPAVTLLAVSYFPVRHSCEVKPYAFDLFWSVVLYWAASHALRRPCRPGWLLTLALLAPLALVSSYPAVFVAGTISLVLLPASWQGGRTTRLLYLLYVALVAISFLGHYELVARKQASPEEAHQVHDFMRNYWRDSFPPEAIRHWPAWLFEVHTGNMLAYPAGGKNGASAVSFVLLLVGAADLLRQRRHALLGLCLLPFGLTFLAAVLGRYPYGGSARVAQHLAAPICLLMGVGAAAVLGCLRSPAQQSRWGFALTVLLSAVGVGGLVFDWVRPYKTLHDWEARRLAHEFAALLQPSDTILVCNNPNDVTAGMKWYLRNDKHALHWLDRGPQPDAHVRQLWLLFFDVQPASEGRVLSLLPQRYTSWSAADCRQCTLPPENNVSHALYFTRLRLVAPAELSLAPKR